MAKVLYKYFAPSAIEEQHIETLINKQFWFGINKIQNDPYDLIGADRFLQSFVGKHMLEFIKGSGGDVKLFRKQLVQFASCSFSRVGTERLMWAHYSQSYKGFCVAFNFEQNEPLHIVTYMDKYPIIGPQFKNNINFNVAEYLNHWIVSKDINVLNDLVTFMASIKSQEWAYEQEERLVEIITQPRVGENIPWSKFGATASYVIFGSNFQHRELAQRMSQVLSTWNLKKDDLFEITTNALENFEINIVPLSEEKLNRFYSQLR